MNGRPVTFRPTAAIALAAVMWVALTARAQSDRWDGVYFGSFDAAGGQWAFVSSSGGWQGPIKTGYHFVGFLPERRQLIEGSPYYFDMDLINGRVWDAGPYPYEGTIDNVGRVKGTAAVENTPWVWANDFSGESVVGIASLQAIQMAVETAEKVC